MGKSGADGGEGLQCIHMNRQMEHAWIFFKNYRECDVSFGVVHDTIEISVSPCLQSVAGPQ